MAKESKKKCDEESLRLRNEIVNSIKEMAQIQQHLWEIIGLIQVAFLSAATLNERIAPFSNIEDYFKNFEH
jgi:hypothetical protein